MLNYYQLVIGDTRNSSICPNLVDIFPQLFDKIIKMPKSLNGSLSMTDLKVMLRTVTIESIYLSVPMTKFSIEYDNGIVLYGDSCVIRIATLFPQLAAFDKMLADMTKTVPEIPKPPCRAEPKRTQLPQVTKPIKQIPEPPKKVVNAPKKMTQEDERFELEKENKRNKVIEQNRIDEMYRIFENDKKSFVQIEKDINDGLLLQDDIHPCFVAKYVVFSILKERGVINFENNNQSRKEYDVFMDLYKDLEYEDPTIGQAPSNVHIPHNYLFMTDAQKEECADKNGMSRKELEIYIAKISSGSISNIFA